MSQEDPELMGQLSLDDLLGHAYARRSDPETSHMAAASLSREKLTSVQSEIMSVFKLAEAAGEPRLTDEQIATWVHARQAVKVSPSGLRSRRAELVAAGYLRDSGRRALTASNRQTILWERVPKLSEDC